MIPIPVYVSDWAMKGPKNAENLRGSLTSNVTCDCDRVESVLLLRSELPDTCNVVMNVSHDHKTH
jgi:hypothetical protein